MNEETLFNEALHQAPEERAAFLERACAGRPELRLAVEALLAEHERPDNILDGPRVDLKPAGGHENGRDQPGSPVDQVLNAHALTEDGPRSSDQTIDHASNLGTTDLSITDQGQCGRLARGTVVRYFGDYEIQGELGRGGMGVVYRAKQISLNRAVALKMIKAGVLADDAELRRFQNEAEAVALLDHPGIVQVYEVGDHEGQRYFSMKLVEGGNLAEKVPTFKTNPRAAATLIAETAEAVHHAHMRGILHRDLKPANILIDDEGHPHVTDFGLAKRVDADVEMTATGAILGTPAYMSPEQAIGRRGSITTATDVYGLGAILYALLAGKSPFGGDSLVETLDAVKTRQPESPKKLNAHVPRDLETICLKCLEKDPRRRYASAHDVAVDLKNWLDSRPIRARRVGVTERAWLWCKRKPAVAALAAAVVLAAVVGAAAGFETYGSLRASALVESLKTASTTEVPAIVKQLIAYRRWAAGPLDHLLKNTEPRSGPHLRASLAGLSLRPGDAKHVEYLEGRLLAVPPVEFPIVWGVLRTSDRGTTGRFRKLLDDPEADPGKRFRAALALANSDDAVESRWDAVALFLSDQFLTSVVNNPADYSPLIEALRPIRLRLLPPLTTIFGDAKRSESERNLATTLLADYANDQPEVLAHLLMDAEPKAYRVFFPLAEKQAARTLPRFRAELGKNAKPDDSEAIKDQLAERQARAAVALVRLGHADQVWPLLKHSADPRLRSFIVSWLKASETDPGLIAAELVRLDSKIKPRPAEGQQAMEAILFHPETSMRRALILAIGTYGTEGLSARERDTLRIKLLDLYRNDPDSGIHGAAEWTLRRWRQHEAIAQADAEMAKLSRWGDRRWFVNGQGHTFAVIEGPVEFAMGSPATERYREASETLSRVRIPRRFAVATKEVSKVDWERFLTAHPEWRNAGEDLSTYTPDPDGPIYGISWFGAAAFCNWLSGEEGLGKNEWCYTPSASGAYDGGTTIPVDVNQRKGYRLPTEAEWEYACRAGTITSRPFGNASEQVPDHAWYETHSAGHAWSRGSLRPNDLGLFDMLGNMHEWCQDEHKIFKANDLRIDEIDGVGFVESRVRVVRGGAWLSRGQFCRSAMRDWFMPSARSHGLGFRLAIVPSPAEARPGK